MGKEVLIGISIPRLDAVEKVIGKAVYGTDLKMPRQLYGKILRSPFAHAKILNVDTSKAKKIIGVKAIATGQDLPCRYGIIIHDQTPICFDKVRYIGDPVAAIAAVDPDTAEEALELIQVDYEELPPIFDPFEAMDPQAPLIHEHLGTYWHHIFFSPVPGTNICNHFKLRQGDIEKGFRVSDFISENTFTTPMAQHCALEPHVSIAQIDEGQVTIWSSTQHPYFVRREVARFLGISISKVHVIVSCVGGGFGGKTTVKLEPLCVALARKDSRCRPVKIVLTREEEFHASVRHPTTISVKAGVRKDGKIMALKVNLVLDTGGYADSGPVVSRSVGMSLSGPYKIPNIWGDSYCVYTNKPIACAFRGFGFPQFMWALESQLDILAEGIGMDPLELRLKNAFEEGDRSSTGQILHSVGIKECIEKASQGIGWKTKAGKNRGKGLGTLYKMTQTPSCSAAIVKLSEDGSAEVLSSTVDIGQGSNTVLAQIAAEELGVDINKTKVVSPDTNVTPYDHGTASSRSTFHMGNAVKQAAADARRQLLEVAAAQLEVQPRELEARGGLIYFKGSRSTGIPISKIQMGVSWGGGRPIIGHGFFSVPDATLLDPETGQGELPSVFWLYGAQAAEVEVDINTGKVQILKIVAAHDLGRAINPLNCIQQIEGAMNMGIGLTLMEELILQEGKVMNPNFRDYLVPTILDDDFAVISIFVEAHHERGPFGAKGVGEPALVPTAAAIGNAIYDAIGVRIRDLPITPEKVLKALKEKGLRQK